MRWQLNKVEVIGKLASDMAIKPLRSAKMEGEGRQTPKELGLREPAEL
jgi:hypothetical protein